VKKYTPVVFKLLVWCGAEGYVSGLQDAGLLSFLLRVSSSLLLGSKAAGALSCSHNSAYNRH